MKVQINLNRYVAFILIFISGCATLKSPNLHKSNEEVIVYRVFDSLEGLLAHQIDLLNIPYDSMGIIIEPAGDFSYTENQEKDGRYVYKISVYSPRDGRKSMLFNSNRKMQIKDRLYPIYFTRFDEVFRQKGEDRNAPFRHNYLPLASDLRPPVFKVDMAKKKVLYSTYLEPKN